MKKASFNKICIAFLFLLFTGTANANSISGRWALDSNVKFDFTETTFCVTEGSDTTNNGNIIEYRYDGPYKVKEDTIIWFNKYMIEANLTTNIIDTVQNNKYEIENTDTFFLGINLNGPAVKIGNQQWFSSGPMLIDSTLKIYGYGDVKPTFKSYSNITGLTGDSMVMIQSAIENNPEGGGNFFSIKIPNVLQHYRLYIWFCRPDSITNKPEDFRFSAYESNIYDGVPNVDTVLTDVGDWVRFGPYHVDARSYLNIHTMVEAAELRNVSVSGFELRKGPSIKDVNTYRYLYKIQNDSLYLAPIEEELFGPVALCKVTSTGNFNKLKRNNYHSVKENQITIFNVLGRKVNSINYKGLYLIYKNDKKQVIKGINLKK